MKIIIGTESFAPSISGVSIATELLASSLAKKRYQVHVFAPDHPKKLDEKFHFVTRRFPSRPNPFREGFYIAKGSKTAVISAVAKIKPDLIHLQDPTNIGTGLLKAAQRFNIPVVVSNHFSLDYLISYLPYLKPVHPIIRFGLRKYLASFYNHCDYVICPTESVKTELLSWGVKKPVEAISNGVDLDRFYSYSSPRETLLKYHLPTNRIVLYVGRIDQDKNLEVLLRAIPRVIKEINAHFIFVGKGKEMDNLKKLAIKEKIERYVSFLGELEHNSEDLPRLYQLAEVFVIPSEFETQSKVTLEAMAAGKPVVGANSGALPELISNGQNGFLFKAGDNFDLSEKIIQILKNQRLAKKMGRRSLKMISEHNLEETINKINHVYEKILAKR